MSTSEVSGSAAAEKKIDSQAGEGKDVSLDPVKFEVGDKVKMRISLYSRLVGRDESHEVYWKVDKVTDQGKGQNEPFKYNIRAKSYSDCYHEVEGVVGKGFTAVAKDEEFPEMQPTNWLDAAAAEARVASGLPKFKPGQRVRYGYDGHDWKVVGSPIDWDGKWRYEIRHRKARGGGAYDYVFESSLEARWDV